MTPPRILSLEANCWSLGVRRRGETGSLCLYLHQSYLGLLWRGWKGLEIRDLCFRLTQSLNGDVGGLRASSQGGDMGLGALRVGSRVSLLRAALRKGWGMGVTRLVSVGVGWESGSAEPF